MADLSPPEGVRALLDDLDEAGIEHMLVGALVMDAYGTPRATRDIDLQIRLDEPVPNKA